MKSFLGELFRHLFLSFLIIVTIALTIINLVFTNFFGESCGILHPYIFEMNVNMVDFNGRSIRSFETTIPTIFTDTDLIGDGTREVTNQGLDTVLRIYDASSGELLASNDDYYDMSSVIWSFQTETDTEIIIEISTYLERYDGRYELFLIDSSDVYENEPYIESEPEGQPIIEDLGEMSWDYVPYAIGYISAGRRIRYHITLPANTAKDIYLSGLITAERGTYLWSRDVNGEDNWSSCLQFYGYFDGEKFRPSQSAVDRYILLIHEDSLLNAHTNIHDLQEYYSFADLRNEAISRTFYGISNASPISYLYMQTPCYSGYSEDGTELTFEGCGLQSSVSLSWQGRGIFYVFLPIIVILIPVFMVRLLRRQNVFWWSFMMLLVTVHVTSTSLLFIHLSEVSGISVLSDFGVGMFGGILTAAALAFISKVIENFSE